MPLCTAWLASHLLDCKCRWQPNTPIQCTAFWHNNTWYLPLTLTHSIDNATNTFQMQGRWVQWHLLGCKGCILLMSTCNTQWLWQLCAYLPKMRGGGAQCHTQPSPKWQHQTASGFDERWGQHYIQHLVDCFFMFPFLKCFQNSSPFSPYLFPEGDSIFRFGFSCNSRIAENVLKGFHIILIIRENFKLSRTIEQRNYKEFLGCRKLCGFQQQHKQIVHFHRVWKILPWWGQISWYLYISISGRHTCIGTKNIFYGLT